MQINFSVENNNAIYRRSWLTGSAVLDVDAQQFTIQNPWNPATHFSLQPSQVWHVSVGRHRIAIEKNRATPFGALRPQTYRIKVDGELVAEQTGY